jgi:hypothetical protein
MNQDVMVTSTSETTHRGALLHPPPLQPEADPPVEDAGGGKRWGRRFKICAAESPELSVYPAVDVDLVAFVLRDVEWISIRIEAAVLRHGTVARSLADAPFGQRV